ncbi:MAG: oxidoreductase [Alphaproteobacteria bacterium]|uniref:alcohol dehydrogenase catalytic domain-containing protein n=1 Tax=Brevundimonas sp. BAL3 TaxID=391600 RepID=UPI00017ED495|nr:alcohol dehydrogenase catalytic domain-containing protein [Brevundimonas sp. BAL3]EDX80112.1 Alcohol dehydrogenase GroES-like domain family [Brevundimonas sp. BAL3]PZO09158.1 MAG: oxidoreductase [Alphaproteobacteria bacterium]
MKAVQLVRPTELVLADLPIPEIRSHEVLLRVTAAGVCHTDVSIRHEQSDAYPSGLVLGHEIAGRIDRVGTGVNGWQVGEDVIVYPCWSCGACRECVAGRQNACRQTGGRLQSPPTPGVTVAGGMADYVAVPASALVRADGIDPAVAAILPDAALVPYHSIRAVEEHLRPGSTAVVIGLGGLGHLAIQMLRALTAARVVALDVNDQALDAVRDHVDLALKSNVEGVAEQIVAFTEGYGADVVLDFVGADATLRLASGVIARYGAILVPGLGCGVLPFETAQTSTILPWGASLIRPYSGTYDDLHQIVDLARSGRISPVIQRYNFEQALDALDDLETGKVRGRAVLIMKVLSG